MLFEPSFFIAAGGVIAVAVVERLADDFGFYWLGNVLKFVIPLAALVAGAYFIETNAIIGWLR
jgi:hypothetical protein